ncbi:MAG: DUF362 domain-containing protein [Firmicutes bacterium]|nr:DUF362 domain-containing protein [Bacillota bacterium]
MSKAIVSIAKCSHYKLQEIAEALKALLEPFGGLEYFVRPQDKVLIKINLLRSATPDKAVTTHPVVAEAVISAVKDLGATPIIGDSPGGTNTPRQIKNIVEATGIADVCRRTETELVIFDRDPVRIKSPEGKLYTSFTVGRIVRDADVIITLPKLKTHGFMKFTGAVKILFGVIPGMEKAQYHLKVPDRMDFADMLLDIYLAVKPTLSIMDAVVGMEGEGPSGGEPRHIGVLLAATNAIAMDFVASKIIGFDPLDVYTNRAAVYRGLIAGLDEISIRGLQIQDIILNDFKAPSSDLADKIPPRLVKFMKNLVTAKPFLAAPEACTGCGICKQNCPSKAITISNKRPHFDFDKCIRCYCCEELCAELAIKRKNHWLASLLANYLSN